jgi:hydrogenase maturation factor
VNLFYGEIVDLRLEDGITIGSVRVSGALKKVPLDLLTNVQVGDEVLLCDGIAISKVQDTEEVE